MPHAACAVRRGAAHAPRASALPLRVTVRLRGLAGALGRAHCFILRNDSTRKHPHDQHQPAQRARRPHGVRAAVEAVDDDLRDSLRRGRQRRRLEAPRHARVHEAGAHDEHAHAIARADRRRAPARARRGRPSRRRRRRCPGAGARRRPTTARRACPPPASRSAPRGLDQQRAGADEVDLQHLDAPGRRRSGMPPRSPSTPTARITMSAPPSRSNASPTTAACRSASSASSSTVDHPRAASRLAACSPPARARRCRGRRAPPRAARGCCSSRTIASAISEVPPSDDHAPAGRAGRAALTAAPRRARAGARGPSAARPRDRHALAEPRSARAAGYIARSTSRRRRTSLVR